MEYCSYITLCRLLITFANSLNPDKDKKNVETDLDPNCLTKNFFEKDYFEQHQQMRKKHEKIPPTGNKFNNFDYISHLIRIKFDIDKIASNYRSAGTSAQASLSFTAYII